VSEVKSRNRRRMKKTMMKMKKRGIAAIIAGAVITLRKFSAVAKVQRKILRKDMQIVGRARRYLKIIVLMR